MYEELVELKKKDMKLKGKDIDYYDLSRLPIGTLVVGRDSNNIYEVIDGQMTYNRKKKTECSMSGIAVCYFLGGNKITEAEDF